jgi:hypothetical protein
MAGQTLSREAKNARTRERNARSHAANQREINARLKEWRSLSPKEQLAELDKRPGRSARQRARILSKLEKRNVASS